MKFIVYGLPRSRTFWLSRYLSYADYECGHDVVRHLRSLEDIKSYFAMPSTGACETAAAPFWRLVQQYQPDIKTVVIRRPIDDVIDSLMKQPITYDRALLTPLIMHMDNKLNQIERRVPNVLSVPYADLAQEETCKAVFEHCLGYQHDPAWFHMMAPINLQCDLPKMMRYYAAYEKQLDKIAKIAKHTMISALSMDSIDKDDGLTIQEEPFATVIRDAQPLIREHCVISGRAPDAEINVPLLTQMDETGHVQVMTARCNGRIFGYLMTIIGPSIEEDGLLSAAQSSFIASSEFKGLGMKLQRASIEGLKAKGVHEVFFKAGIRGDGNRMGNIFRRVGAAHFGEQYRLDLTNP